MPDNKRVQRMAYGASNKEVARSTADAPDVRWGKRGDMESDATTTPVTARRFRLSTWSRRALFAAIGSLALSVVPIAILFGMGATGFGLWVPEWLALSIWACVPAGGVLALVAFAFVAVALVKREWNSVWIALIASVVAVIPQTVYGLLAIGILGSTLAR